VPSHRQRYDGRPMDPRFTARLLIVLGYVALIMGSLIWLIQSISDDAHPGIVVYLIAAALAYGVVAWSWWLWAKAMITVRGQIPSLRRSFRAFGASSVILAVGFLAYAIQLNADHFKGPYVAATVIELLGAAMIAAGFWRMADVVSRPDDLTPK
jgi:uncharacterized membrane protein